MTPPLERPAPRRLDRSRVADRVLDDIRNKIAGGQISRGARLPSERELAAQYGVSGATIREAISGLSALGFVDVRHGSGAYVSAGGNTLVSTSLGALLQLEEVSIADILGVLAVLNLHAADQAVTHATETDLAAIAEAVQALPLARTADALADALRHFLHALAAAAHNPLVAALCNFLSDVQIGLALELSGRSFKRWRTMTAALQTERIAILTALRSRERDAALEAVRAYQTAAMALVTALPYGRRKRVPSASLAGTLSALQDARREDR